MKDSRIEYRKGTIEHQFDNVINIVNEIPTDPKLKDVEAFSIIQSFGYKMEKLKNYILLLFLITI